MKAGRALVALAAAASWASACGPSREQRAPLTREPFEVTVVSVSAVDTAERLEAGGIVAARESATVSSRIVATVDRVRVRAGDQVRRGDVLVVLDARDDVERTRQARAGALAAEKALVQARSEQSAAESEQRLAVAWQKRIATLHARNSATDQERDEAEARAAAAAARAAGAQAAIESADAQLGFARAALSAASVIESYATLVAPFDGLITERLTDPGNLASPGVPLLRIETSGTREVVVRVDEARVAYLRPGDRVDVEVDDHGESGRTTTVVAGVVAEVARVVESAQRAFTVKVSVPDTLTARSGSFARVVFRGEPRRVLVVAEDAIRRQGQVASAYVVQDGVARLRLVQTGLATTAGVEILAGLDAGESIVARPPAGLADGTRVAVRAPRPSEGGPR